MTNQLRLKVGVLMVALSLMAGCAVKTAPQTLPTGARDTADANAFRVIADAAAFLQSIRNSVASGALTLTATQKQLFNDAAASYDAAYAVGEAYHNGTATQATLTSATKALQSKIQAASTEITVAK